MIETLFRFYYETMWGISAILKNTPDSLCAIETAVDNDILALSNDSLISVLEIDGSLKLLDDQAIDAISVRFGDQFSSSFSKSGHFMQFVFMRDPERGMDVVKKATAPARLTAHRMRLDMEDFFDSQEMALSKYVAFEKAWIVIGTTRKLLNPAEKKQDKNREIPLPKGIGSGRNSAGSPFLLPRHRALVKSLQDIFKNESIVTRLMSASEVIETNRSIIDPEHTSKNWKARIPGKGFPVTFPRPGQSKKEFSHILWPSPGKQMFPRDAFSRSLTTVEVGEWIHAPLAVSMPPESPFTFSRLFEMLAPSEIPWRASFLVTGDALSEMFFKEMMAAFLAWTASENKLMVDSMKSLRKYKNSGGAVTGWQAMFDTWAPKDDPKLLAVRSSTLAQAVQGWGNCDTTTQTGDPLIGMVSSLPGFASGKAPSPKAAAPLEDALFMSPLYRPALPWQEGACLLRSPDGKLMCYQPGSTEQPAFVEIGVGPMGYGKSAFLSTSNLALALSPGRDSLPWIMTVDRGPSSAGLVNLIRSRLPDKPEFQRLAAFYRLQNTEEYAINPLDTPLGCRKPLPLHRSFLQNLFTILATPVTGDTLDGIPGLMQIAIDRTYMDMAPFSEGGIRPRLYEAGLMPEIDAAIHETGYLVDIKTTWWDLEDWFFDKGRVMESMLCHRRCVPKMSDIAATINDPTVSDIYRAGTTRDIENLAAFAWRSLIESINQYPILSETTRFDIGDARIVALDLDEVTQGSGPVADRQSVIMYMMARHVLGSRLFLMPDHVRHVEPRYRDYHASRIEEIRRDHKKLAFDEFHKVSQNPILVEQFQRDLEITIRESRKWNLHIGLYSQKIEDFPDTILDQATTVLVFGVGTEDESERVTQKMKLSDSIARALPRITKPTEAGSNMVAAFRTSKGFVQQYLTNTLGPVALWSYSTVAEDQAIRSLMQAEFGVKEAIRRLVARYPGGIKGEVERRQRLKGNESGDIIREIFNELASDSVLSKG